jgi:hypothetical protein
MFSKNPSDYQQMRLNMANQITNSSSFHTITASAVSSGTIMPAGSVSVNHGGSQAFTITSLAGYRVSNVLVDGVSVGAITTYNLTNVTANHTIQAQFAPLDNLNAGFVVDADLADPGYQGPNLFSGIGDGKLCGFALYAKYWKNVRGFNLQFSWNPEKATFQSSLSSISIADNKMNINGKIITPVPEGNIFGGFLSSLGEQAASGFISRSYANLESVIPDSTDGLIYIAVFKTAASFTFNDSLAIRINIRILDKQGVEVDLGESSFIILAGIQPPSNLILSDVPNDQGHSLHLTWIDSPSELNGLVSFYRIYRSLSDVMTDPFPLSQFSSLDSLNVWEQHHTILIDSVAAGQAAYIDKNVGITGATYHYWIQAVGSTGESRKIAAGITTEVEERNTPSGTFRLWEAHPNPFNPSTTIQYDIPSGPEISVRLKVYDTRGALVHTLVDGLRGPGIHTTVWNGVDDEGRRISSGIYFYRMEAGGFTKTQKMLLVK